MDKIINTMHVGHIVTAKIIKEITPSEFECEFICHTESKRMSLCLDAGQNWHINNGEKFTTGQAQIDRAAWWLSQAK